MTTGMTIVEIRQDMFTNQHTCCLSKVKCICAYYLFLFCMCVCVRGGGGWKVSGDIFLMEEIVHKKCSFLS
jgi:hypothetical protein